MKRERNRKIHNYARYDDERAQYYGIFPKYKEGTYFGENRFSTLKIDPKRLLKTNLIDEETYNKIQSVNRNTKYYYPPAKIKDKFSHFCSIINHLQKLWREEYLPAIKRIETPEEVEERNFNAVIASAITADDYEECQEKSFLERIKRIPSYNYAVNVFYGQYVLIIGSYAEATMLTIVSQIGYVNDSFNRKKLIEFIKQKTSLDISEFETYKYYDKLYKLWNFIKHNNKDCYKKLYVSFPELFKTDSTYKAGQLAIGYIKLGENLFKELFEGLKSFYAEFCCKVFGEYTSFEDWESEMYYVKIFKEHIDNLWWD